MDKDFTSSEGNLLKTERYMELGWKSLGCVGEAAAVSPSSLRDGESGLASNVRSSFGLLQIWERGRIIQDYCKKSYQAVKDCSV